MTLYTLKVRKSFFVCSHVPTELPRRCPSQVSRGVAKWLLRLNPLPLSGVWSRSRSRSRPESWQRVGVGVGVDQATWTPTPARLLHFDPVRVGQKYFSVQFSGMLPFFNFPNEHILINELSKPTIMKDRLEIFSVAYSFIIFQFMSVCRLIWEGKVTSDRSRRRTRSRNSTTTPHPCPCRVLDFLLYKLGPSQKIVGQIR